MQARDDVAVATRERRQTPAASDAVDAAAAETDEITDVPMAAAPGAASARQQQQRESCKSQKRGHRPSGWQRRRRPGAAEAATLPLQAAVQPLPSGGAASDPRPVPHADVAAQPQETARAQLCRSGLSDDVDEEQRTTVAEAKLLTSAAASGDPAPSVDAAEVPAGTAVAAAAAVGESAPVDPPAPADERHSFVHVSGGAAQAPEHASASLGDTQPLRTDSVVCSQVSPWQATAGSPMRGARLPQGTCIPETPSASESEAAAASQSALRGSPAALPHPRPLNVQPKQTRALLGRPRGAFMLPPAAAAVLQARAGAVEVRCKAALTDTAQPACVPAGSNMLDERGAAATVALPADSVAARRGHVASVSRTVGSDSVAENCAAAGNEAAQHTCRAGYTEPNNRDLNAGVEDGAAQQLVPASLAPTAQARPIGDRIAGASSAAARLAARVAMQPAKKSRLSRRGVQPTE